MEFGLNILGCGSATPSLRHLPSSQVVDHRDRLFMVDCGEGAQLGMRRMRLKYSRLAHIFLSHLHGDHCLGLPGLLSTLALHGATGTVTVHTFADGAEVLGRVTDFFCRERPYRLEFNVIDQKTPAVVYEDRSLRVETFPLYHRVPCVGYIFRELPKQRHIIREMVDFWRVPVSQMQAIKEGADFVAENGTVVPNSRLTSPADPSHSYAYCSDTVFDPCVADAVRGVDTIYHEATYIDADAVKARDRGHATASQAARIALEAGAKRLILGHYSKSYNSEEQHLAEARAIFPNTFLASEGLTFDLANPLSPQP